MAHYPASAVSYSPSYDPSDLLPFHNSLSAAASSHSHLDNAYLPPATMSAPSSYMWNTPATPVHDQRTWNTSASSSSSSSSSFSSIPMSVGRAAPSYSSQCPSDYPESSQRNVLPDGLASPSAFRSHSSITHRSSDSARLSRTPWDSDLYPVPGMPPMSTAPLPPPTPVMSYVVGYSRPPRRAAPPPPPRIKSEEQPEGSFIFELPAAEVDPECEPMPEVPLRATQACKKMRRMMGAFRLDPFAIHNGIRSAAVPAPPGLEIGPLREEPVLIEWQIELDEPPRSPSPASDWRAPLYPLDDAHDDDKWMPALGYQGFAPVGSPEFEPLMTPAQSLNWSMGYPGDGAAQPLSMFRTAHAASASPKNEHIPYEHRGAPLQPAPAHTNALRLPTRCQQEFVGVPALWYRRNALPADCYAAVT